MNATDTSQKIAELQALRAKARAWRVGTTVVSFVIPTVCLLILRNSAGQLVEDGPTHEQFIAELKTGLTQQVVPEVKTLASQTWTDLQPALRAEMAKVKLRGPELTGHVRTELSLMADHLPARANRVLSATVGQMLRQREPALRAAYGDITQEQVQRAVELLLAECSGRAVLIADRVVNPYEQTLNGIIGNLDAIQLAELPGRDAHSEQEIAALLLQLMQPEPVTTTKETAVVATPNQFAEAR